MRLSREVNNDAGAARVASAQASKVLHGPGDAAGGYEVRRISSISKVSGEIDRQDHSASGMTTTGDTRSVTSFTVNEAQTYAFRSDQHADTDSPVDACASVTFTLKRSTTAVSRLTEQRGVGCDTRPDVGAGAGTLARGSYTLITQTHRQPATGGQLHGGSFHERDNDSDAATRHREGLLQRPACCRSTITGTRCNDVLCGSS